MTALERSPLGLVVPVFDEAARLRDYGKELVDFATGLPPGSRVVFVDDGSRDGTAELVAELVTAMPGAPVQVLRRPHRGKGAAITAGLQSLDTPLRGFCDVDLSTPLDDLQHIVAVAGRAGALAVGSRDLTASRLVQPEGTVRELLGRAYNRLLQALVTPGVVDTQCGAKVAPAWVWDAVLPHCREEGFAWDAEAIAVAKALGVAVLEVPVRWRHDERSKVNLGRDGLAMLAATPRIWRTARRLAAARPGLVQVADAAREADDGAQPPGGSALTAAVADPATDVARCGQGEVFDDANAVLLAGSDRTHWWFRSKAALVATALRRTGACDGPGTPDGGCGWLVDLGGGAGGVTAMLGWNPDRVAVVEGNRTLARQAQRRHGLGAVGATVHQVPLADGSADVVCLLDVVEHLADPVGALREAARLLRPGGRLVVNVPAHRWLWSPADDQLGHLRRYDRRMLRAELAAAGVRPVLLSHVFSWLVPPVWLKRKVVSTGSAELGIDQTSALIDAAAMVLTFAERMLLGRATMRFGTSVLGVAVKDAVAGSDAVEGEVNDR